MYKGILEPNFNYCCSVWSSCGTTKLNKLEKLQNIAAIIVTNNCNFSATSLIQDLGWPTIEELIYREISVMSYKYLNKLTPTISTAAFIKFLMVRHMNFGILRLIY